MEWQASRFDGEISGHGTFVVQRTVLFCRGLKTGVAEGRSARSGVMLRAGLSFLARGNLSDGTGTQTSNHRHVLRYVWAAGECWRSARWFVSTKSTSGVVAARGQGAAVMAWGSNRLRQAHPGDRNPHAAHLSAPASPPASGRDEGSRGGGAGRSVRKVRHPSLHDERARGW